MDNMDGTNNDEFREFRSADASSYAVMFTSLTVIFWLLGRYVVEPETWNGWAQVLIYGAAMLSAMGTVLLLYASVLWHFAEKLGPRNVPDWLRPSCFVPGVICVTYIKFILVRGTGSREEMIAKVCVCGAIAFLSLSAGIFVEGIRKKPQPQPFRPDTHIQDPP